MDLTQGIRVGRKHTQGFIQSPLFLLIANIFYQIREKVDFILAIILIAETLITLIKRCIGQMFFKTLYDCLTQSTAGTRMR